MSDVVSVATTFQAEGAAILEGRMDPNVKADWLTALRSGDYKQTQGCLRDDTGYCCLGVLTDLWVKGSSVEWHPKPFGTAFSIATPGWGAESSVTPRGVMSWSDLTNSTGTTLLGAVTYHAATEGETTDNFYVTLSDLNDNGFTFEQIADVIEYAL